MTKMQQFRVVMSSIDRQLKAIERMENATFIPESVKAIKLLAMRSALRDSRVAALVFAEQAHAEMKKAG